MAGNTCCHIGSSYIIYGHVFKGSMHIYNSGGAASSQPNRMWGAAPAKVYLVFTLEEIQFQWVQCSVGLGIGDIRILSSSMIIEPGTYTNSSSIICHGWLQHERGQTDDG